MATTQQNEIDFLPMVGINEDFTKLYNEFDDISSSHLALHKLITLIELPVGKHRFLPNLGIQSMFLKLPFTDMGVLSNRLVEIENRIKSILNLDVNIDYNLEHKNGGQVLNLVINCDRLPGKVAVTVQNDNTKNVAERVSTRILK